jgi:hypothetical protein
MRIEAAMTDNPIVANTPVCSEPDCDHPIRGRGLCTGHLDRVRRGSSKTGPLNAAELLADDPHIECPPGLLDLAGQCADLDARNIARVLWPHLLEASLAGVEPFTLEATS